VLNTGTSRRIPSTEYETVLGGLDYVQKVWRYTRDGFVAHVHVNGKSPKGLVLALIGELIGAMHGRPTILTFHAGEDQTYFPRSKAPAWAPLFRLLFALPARIICNSEAVKARICEYGVSDRKVTPIPAFSRQYLQFDRVSLGEPLEAFWHRFDHVLFSYLNIRAGYYPETLLQGFLQLRERRSDVGLVMCGMLGHREAALWERVQSLLADARLQQAVCLVDDLDHDQFLTALSRSTAFVRTPPEDGVSSSVLEALALQVPVVAARNETRPAGALMYTPTDAGELCTLLEDVIERHDEIASSIPRPEIDDTLSEEARLLTT